MKLAGSVAVIAASVFGLTVAQGSLPTVDLGYEVHQAIAFNATGNYYNFSNIRYAQAPVGDLRFAIPVPPAGRDPTVQTGSQERICPQAGPAWSLIASQLASSFSNGSLDEFSYARARDIAMSQLMAAANNPAPADPRVSEDCLFLDVMAPAPAFDGRNQTGSGNGTGAPVLVWIYGGGYTLGSKTAYGSPAGIIAQSMRGMGANTSEPIIWVAMNYRLGAMGFLGGPSVQQQGGVSNAALYDQRLAIQWVRQNIHLFGGDPNRITIMGESAGGGSIMHQITAFGGNKGVNFQRAIVQSPGWFPISSGWVQENTTQSFFKYLNVSTLAEARAANSSAIIRANAIQVAASTYGQYTYGPAVDGVFVPAQPGLALMTGQYAQNVQIMAGHNTNEGVYFAPAYATSDADVSYWLKTNYPLAAPQALDYMTSTLYPPTYDGTLGYTTPLTRAIKMLSEQVFTCNTNYLARAQRYMTFNYQFEVPPALHGYDIPYTFYNGGSGVVTSVAIALQRYIVNFAATGNPNAPDLPMWPMEGQNVRLVGMNVSGITIQPDTTANDRCLWLQKYLYT